MNIQEIINIFKKAAAFPTEEATQWKKETKGKVIGFMLTDVPEELIFAAGFLPFAVHTVKGKLEYADAHLQSWACSYSRSCLAAAVQGKLSVLDGLIIPQTCDTTRMLMGIWKRINTLSLMEDFRLPRQVDRPSAKAYLRGELERLKGSLESLRGKEIEAEELKKAISLYNRNRQLLRSIYMFQGSAAPLIRSEELFTIIEASMVMPREKVNFLLEELLLLLKRGSVNSRQDKSMRLLISGTLLEPLQLVEFINEKGGVIVADDLQNGSRYLEADAEEAGDPLEALTQRQLTRMPSALYESQKIKRAEYLVNLARHKAADGVLFVHLKFCEPENYDYYDNMQAMEIAGIPAMKVESSFGGIPLGQLQTRVHAFMEMLGG